MPRSTILVPPMKPLVRPLVHAAHSRRRMAPPKETSANALCRVGRNTIPYGRPDGATADRHIDLDESLQPRPVLSTLGAALKPARETVSLEVSSFTLRRHPRRRVLPVALDLLRPRLWLMRTGTGRRGVMSPPPSPRRRRADRRIAPRTPPGERRQPLLGEHLGHCLRDRRLKRDAALLVRDDVVLPTLDLDQVADLDVELLGRDCHRTHGSPPSVRSWRLPLILRSAPTNPTCPTASAIWAATPAPSTAADPALAAIVRSVARHGIRARPRIRVAASTQRPGHDVIRIYPPISPADDATPPGYGGPLSVRGRHRARSLQRRLRLHACGRAAWRAGEAVFASSKLLSPARVPHRRAVPAAVRPAEGEVVDLFEIGRMTREAGVLLLLCVATGRVPLTSGLPPPPRADVGDVGSIARVVFQTATGPGCLSPVAHLRAVASARSFVGGMSESRALPARGSKLAGRLTEGPSPAA